MLTPNEIVIRRIYLQSAYREGRIDKQTYALEINQLNNLEEKYRKKQEEFYKKARKNLISELLPN